eukprot:5925522-Amphidinium_carterae.1
MLVMSVQGKALLLCKAAERNNGYEAWSRLKAEYEPKAGTRRTGMLVGILNPKWNEKQAPREFAEAVTAWEEMIQRYEREAGTPLADDVKVAVVLSWAPEPLRQHLRMASHQFENEYRKMRVVLDHMVRAGTEFDATGGLQKGSDHKSWKGKGSGKHKDSGGKDKGKHVDKGKGKGAGKAKGDGKTSKGTPYFAGYCSNCNKWGHKKIHCKSGGGQVAAAETEQAPQGPSASSTGGSVGGVVAGDEQRKKVMFVMAVQEHGNEHEDILGDSGSDEHCCPPWFASHFPTHKSTVPLKDIQGKEIENEGIRTVYMQTDDGMQFSVDFVVSNVSKAVVSLGKLNERGCKVQLGLKEDMEQGMVSHDDGLQIPLCKRRQTWYLKAKALAYIPEDVKLVAPLANGEPPMEWEFPEEQLEVSESRVLQEIPIELREAVGTRANPIAVPDILMDAGREETEPVMRIGSTRDQLRSRLMEYGASTAGTKVELWTRLCGLELKKRKEERENRRLAERQEELRAGRVPPGPAILESPKEPTPLERELHNATHTPPARWCEYCVMGRGREDAHFRTGATADREVPVVELDFCFMNAEGLSVAEQAQAAFVILVGVDCATGYPMAVASTEKTPTKHLSRCVVSFLQRVHGLGQVKLRVDTELATLKLVGEVIKDRGGSTLVEKARTEEERTPRYSSSSKGTVENMCKIIQGLVRSLRYATESKYQMRLTPDRVIWPYLVRHAAFILARFHVKPSGVTPYFAVFGEDYKETLTEFGETILAKIPTSHAGRTSAAMLSKKADTTWRRCIWLGRTENSAEHLVGFQPAEGAEASSIVTVRTIRRLEEAKRTDKALLESIIGAPWMPPGLPRGAKGKRALVLPTLEHEIGIDEEAELESRSAAATPRTPRTGGDPASTTPRDVRPRVAEEGEQGGTLTPRGQDEDEQRGIKRQPSMDEALLRSSVEERRGEKRPAETELTRQQSEMSDTVVGGIVRKKSALDFEYFTVDEADEVNADLPDLDVEQMVKKNAEEVEPDPATEQEDVFESKMAELDFFNDIGAMEPVGDEEVDPTCKVDVTWVVEWRGKDGWRARCVARDYKFMSPDRDDLFAATSSSITSRIVGAYAMKYGLPTFTADVTKAYLQVPEEELVFVLAPPEYEEWCRRNGHTHKRWWRMKNMLYGRRPAATKWVNWASDHVKACGFSQFAGAPYIFFHAEDQCLVELHMDDFYGAGSMSAVEKFQTGLKERMKLKRFVIHRVPDKDNPEVKYDHLKRLRVRTESSMQIHPNSKHTAM